MGMEFTEPKVVECKPFNVVGYWATYEGDNESPVWTKAYSLFAKYKHKIADRIDTNILGFLYQPHSDHPEIAENVKACFIGVNVESFQRVAEGLQTTTFPAGAYVVMNCIADTQDEAAESVGEMVGKLTNWIAENGHKNGDACFASSDESEPRPPFKEYVYIHFQR